MEIKYWFYLYYKRKRINSKVHSSTIIYSFLSINFLINLHFKKKKKTPYSIPFLYNLLIPFFWKLSNKKLVLLLKKIYIVWVQSTLVCRVELAWGLARITTKYFIGYGWLSKLLFAIIKKKKKKKKTKLLFLRFSLTKQHLICNCNNLPKKRWQQFEGIWILFFLT